MNVVGVFGFGLFFEELFSRLSEDVIRRSRLMGTFIFSSKSFSARLFVSKRLQSGGQLGSLDENSSLLLQENARPSSWRILKFLSTLLPRKTPKVIPIAPL